MKEDFQQFRSYTYPAWAGKFLDAWCTRAMRSKIDPMKKMARTLRNKRELLLNWFRAEGRLSSGVVEGFNNKLKLITRTILEIEFKPLARYPRIRDSITDAPMGRSGNWL